MHPLFATGDPNVVPPTQSNSMLPPGMSDQSMMYGQPQQQQQQMPTMMNPTNNYYQPTMPSVHENVINNNAINYQNFATNIPGAQSLNNQMTYPIESVQPPIKEAPIVHEKPPLPEEFIHFQTVFEELKNRCVSAANNPVRFYFKKLINFLIIHLIFQ
jgi:protein transport protein SEC31